MEEEKEDFRPRDPVTGKKQDNPLNRKRLGKHEMDELFLSEDYC